MYCNNCGKANPKNSKFCQHCGIKLHAKLPVVNKTKKSTKGTPEASSDTLIADREPYPYVISIAKLSILFLATAGLYQFIWFYKQFRSFKYEMEWNIRPFWRTIFSDIIAYSLFKRVMSKKKYAAVLALAFMAIQGLVYLPFPYSILGYLYFLALIPVQKSINSYWAEKYPDRVQASTFNNQNVIWTVLGSICVIAGLAYSVYTTYSNTPFVKNLMSQGGSQVADIVKIADAEESSNDSWVSYTDARKTFTASYPIKPTQSVDTTGDYPYYTYNSEESDSVAYFSAVMTYDDDADITDTDTLLSNILDSMLSSEESSVLVSVSNNTFQGYPAKEFEFTQDDMTAKGTIFIADKTMYIFFATYYTEDGVPATYSKFMDSIEVL